MVSILESTEFSPVRSSGVLMVYLFLLGDANIILCPLLLLTLYN